MIENATCLIIQLLINILWMVGGSVCHTAREFSHLDVTYMKITLLTLPRGLIHGVGAAAGLVVVPADTLKMNVSLSRDVGLGKLLLVSLSSCSRCRCRRRRGLLDYHSGLLLYSRRRMVSWLLLKFYKWKFLLPQRIKVKKEFLHSIKFSRFINKNLLCKKIIFLS